MAVIPIALILMEVIPIVDILLVGSHMDFILMEVIPMLLVSVVVGFQEVVAEVVRSEVVEVEADGAGKLEWPFL